MTQNILNKRQCLLYTEVNDLHKGRLINKIYKWCCICGLDFSQRTGSSSSLVNLTDGNWMDQSCINWIRRLWFSFSFLSLWLTQTFSKHLWAAVLSSGVIAIKLMAFSALYKAFPLKLPCKWMDFQMYQQNYLLDRSHSSQHCCMVFRGGRMP